MSAKRPSPSFFQTKKIVDPRTQSTREVSPEEQLELLSKGIIFNVPVMPANSEAHHPRGKNEQ